MRSCLREIMKLHANIKFQFHWRSKPSPPEISLIVGINFVVFSENVQFHFDRLRNCYRTRSTKFDWQRSDFREKWRLNFMLAIVVIVCKSLLNHFFCFRFGFSLFNQNCEFEITKWLTKFVFLNLFVADIFVFLSFHFAEFSKLVTKFWLHFFSSFVHSIRICFSISRDTQTNETRETREKEITHRK